MGTSISPVPSGVTDTKVSSLISSLLTPKDRDHSLLELSKIRESYEPLPQLLWSTPAVVAVLLYEVISIYPLLTQPTLAATTSTRVCNALALMQCLASHTETRLKFIQAQLPLYLYPILSSASRSRPFEYLRLTSLGIIGALVKHDSPEVIKFLIATNAIPICLRIMETGNELCKTVAIFIIQKTLLDEFGLNFICQSYNHFYSLVTVLNTMTCQLVEMPSTRLLKHVIRCYLRLSDNLKARETLKQCLPESLRLNSFAPLIADDAVTKRCLAQLLTNLDIANTISTTENKS